MPFSARVIVGVVVIPPVAFLILLRGPIPTGGGGANSQSAAVASPHLDQPQPEPPKQAVTAGESAALPPEQTVAAPTPTAQPETPAVLPKAPEAAVSQPFATPRPASTKPLEEPRNGQPTPLFAPVTSSSVEPDRPKFVGLLSIESPVAGAHIHIDGKPVGVTPLVEWQLAAGSHVVRVELDGYLRWSSVVQIVSGKKVNLVANLQSIQPE